MISRRLLIGLAVFSALAFGYVEDLGRVFRQVHRVLKVGAPLGPGGT